MREVGDKVNYRPVLVAAIPDKSSVILMLLGFISEIRA
jgi:hypothetical protein